MKIVKLVTILVVLFLMAILWSFSLGNEDQQNADIKQEQRVTRVAYFASGCFWCVEAIFESVNGVEEVISGYAGGHTENPTYKVVGRGRTGHAETVAVYYKPEIVSFQTLVTVFFGSHDPTTKNGQHPDYGSQYRSIAFHKTKEEKQIIDKTIKRLNKDVYDGKIVTEVKKIKKFYPAEEYHQNFKRLNPEHPYVKKVSVPRLNRFKHKFPELLKKRKDG